MNEKRPPGCENCQNPCVIHFTQIVDGHMQKLDMCETCPHAKHMKDPMEFGLMEKLLGIAMQQGVAVPGQIVGGVKCGHCGYPESKFKKTGRLGCPECYDVFITNKMGMLKKIQDAVLHKGKVPRHHDKRSARVQLAQLNKELQACIDVEDYEQAAQIRDKIKTLKKDLDKNNSKDKKSSGKEK